MFNWNDQGQVGGTIWGECKKSEDHIVPHPDEIEEDTLFSFEDYREKPKNEGGSVNTGSTEQTFQAENDFLNCKLENSRSFHANEELSASGIEMDTWPDFSNLNASLSDGHSDGNDQVSFVAELMNHLSDAPSLNSLGGGTVQLDGGGHMFGCEDKENNSFFYCDWANIGDLDDLDKIFRNSDGIFGHEMLDDAVGNLSPSTDVISRTAQSIPVPDIPLWKDQSSDKSCSSFQSDEQSDGKRCNLQKEEMDGQKGLVRSQNKEEEKSENKPSRNIYDALPNNVDGRLHIPNVKLHSSGATPSTTFGCKPISQKTQVGDAKPVEHFDTSNQVMFSEHGFPTYSFPGNQVPSGSDLSVDRNQKRSVPVCLPKKQRNIPNKIRDAKSVTMTPQEKIKKLRRRQQMHAMLAVQQQQQQYSHQTIGNDNTILQACSQKNQRQDATSSTFRIEKSSHELPSLELNMLEEQDNSQRISTLIDGPSVEETIYNQLQEAVGKLDNKVRLCIRDSLFRLARSVMERQSANDRGSTNKGCKDEDEFSADEQSNNHGRSRMLEDSERDTNPIDRIVAQLLFQSPTASFSRPATDELV